MTTSDSWRLPDGRVAVLPAAQRALYASLPGWRLLEPNVQDDVVTATAPVLEPYQPTSAAPPLATYPMVPAPPLEVSG